MPLGTTLLSIRNALKAEIGNSLTVTSANDSEYDKILDGIQETLCLEYDWPFLDTRADVTVTANNQTANLPTTINLLKEFKVEVKWDDLWYPVVFGVGGRDYNVYNSELSPIPERSDRIMRWRWATTTTFEVWPIPETSQTIRFTGQAKPTTLDGDSDVAVLDGLLLVYFAAAQLLARHKMPDAPLMLQKAQQRLQRLRQNQPARDVPFVLGGDPRPRRYKVYATTG